MTSDNKEEDYINIEIVYKKNEKDKIRILGKNFLKYINKSENIKINVNWFMRI
jgi:hypothetical protein